MAAIALIIRSWAEWNALVDWHANACRRIGLDPSDSTVPLQLTFRFGKTEEATRMKTLLKMHGIAIESPPPT